MTLEDLQSRQLELRDENKKREWLRYVLARGLMVLWQVACWITLVTSSSFIAREWEWVIPHALYLGLLGWFGGKAIIGALSPTSGCYWPRLAEVVYGSYASEHDVWGDRVALDWVLNDRIIKNALGLKYAIGCELAVAYHGQRVFDILPLTIKHSALPFKDIVKVKTIDSTFSLGRNHFINNLDDFTIAGSTASEWLSNNHVGVDSYVVGTIATVYFGKRLTREFTNG